MPDQRLEERIVKQLISAYPEYTTGGQLAECFKVSRQSVWKAIKRLSEQGYSVESKHRIGYRLAKTEHLNKTTLGLIVSQSQYFEYGLYFESIGSTNHYLKAHANQLPQTLVFADMQTAGRGRLGRNWHSQSGAGLWFSMLLRPQIAPQSAVMLTQVAALAMQQAILTVAEVETQIKWPNDIVYGDKKLCGILTEMASEVGAVQYIVIGIGLNVAQQRFDKTINDIAISLRQITGLAIDRKCLLADFIAKFEHYYENFLQDQDLRSIVTALNRLSNVVGKQVWIINGDQRVAARAQAIDQLGRLEVTDENEQQQFLHYGEISIRRR